MSTNVYIWTYQYKDIEGNTKFGLASSPNKPDPSHPFIEGTLKTVSEEDAKYLSINPDTGQVFDIRTDPTYLENLKQEKIKNLQDQTFNYITKYMPLWKQNSWAQYMRCYDKMQSGISLSPAEQQVINDMTDNLSQDPTEVYKKCQNALAWIIECKTIHKQVEDKINSCTSYEEVENINIAEEAKYPPFNI